VLDGGQQVVVADAVERDAVEHFFVAVIVVGAHETVGHTHPYAAVEEDTVDFPALQLHLVKMLGLACGDRHHRLADREVGQEISDASSSTGTAISNRLIRVVGTRVPRQCG